MFATGKMPEQIIAEKDLKKITNIDEIKKLCKEAIDANPTAINDIKEGKQKAFQVLVGYIMKQSQGKADPKLVNEILAELLTI
jgi:aspartyl-tRNA(Asn)/glutamyl-tRNA(Gln) amidotransferase subunit B